MASRRRAARRARARHWRSRRKWPARALAKSGYGYSTDIARESGGATGARTAPRVLGIECAGEAVDALGSDLAAGERVAVMMGAMDRQYDDACAAPVRGPRPHVSPLTTTLEWSVLAVLREMIRAAHGRPGSRCLDTCKDVRVGGESHRGTRLPRRGRWPLNNAAATAAEDREDHDG